MSTTDEPRPDPEAQMRHRLRRHNRALAELAATKAELVSALLHELRTESHDLATTMESLSTELTHAA